MTPPQSEPLTCETALERLDVVWLDPLPEEPLDADVLAAREHLQECSVCWMKWEARRAADLRISGVMQDVPVPSGLREQLLAQCVADVRSTQVEPQAAATGGTGSGHERRQQRRAWWISVAAMMLVSVAGGSWLWQTLNPPRTSMQTLCDHTPLTSAGLMKVDDLSKLPPLPVMWQRVKGLSVPHWFTPPSSREAAGWVAFDLRIGKTSTRGVLLMTRQSNVSDPPPELLVRPIWFQYTQRGGSPVSVAAWSERGVVYLCFVPGEPKALDRVLQATAPTSA
ncbi:MAG: hypothetical protein ACKV2Q_20245 [Planctomycetaceae bacterium]